MPARHAACLTALAASLLLAAPARDCLAQDRSTPPGSVLDFDPAKPEPVNGWWTNGRELMRLDPNGAYRMWLTQDRFQRPIEVGAWRRSNYVFFDLEPYHAKPGTLIRVQLVKEDGETKINRPDTARFRRIPVPPHVFADDAIGVWTAPNENLVILDNGRYEYRRTNSNAGITQHDGIWRTDGNFVFLAPDSPTIDTIRLQGVQDAEGRWQLATAGGRFEKLRPDEPIVAPKDAAPVAKPVAPAPPASPAKPAAPGQPAPAAPPASGTPAPAKPSGNA
jgi:hypothetical protein